MSSGGKLPLRPGDRSVPPAEFAEPELVKIVWTLEAAPLGPCLTRFRRSVGNP